MSGSIDPREIPNDAETIHSSHFFDGLPSGTEKVILRFLEADAAYGDMMMTFRAEEGETVTSRRVGVLGEVTIDLSTGKAVPSETYREAGLEYAQDYQSAYHSLNWHMGFDDLQHREGYPQQMDLFLAEDLFQNGITLEALSYQQGKGISLGFLSTAVLERDLDVRVVGEDGTPAALGKISQDSVTNQAMMRNFNSEEEMRAALTEELREICGEGEEADAQIASELDAYLKTEPGKYYFSKNLDLIPGKSLKLMDHATVTLRDPDTGETVYERSFRIVRGEYW